MKHIRIVFVSIIILETISGGIAFNTVIEDKINLTPETDTTTFQTTNYPSDYPNDEKRTWLIEAPQNDRISLIFTGFKVPAIFYIACLKAVEHVCHSEPQVRLGVHEMNLGNDYRSSPVPYWAY